MGELIAAIATVITLAYLAFQIRSNTIAMRAEARRANRAESAATFRMIAGNSEVAKILRIGLAEPATLDPTEAVQFRFLFAELVGSLETAYKEWRLGTADEDELLETLRHVRPLLASPGGREYWRQDGPGYDAEFREYMRLQLE